MYHSLPFQVGRDGIVVGEVHSVVHLAGEGFPMVRTEDVIDAHIDGILIERPPDAVGRGTIGIRQTRADSVVGIGNGGVVKVTHQDDGHALMAVNKLRHGVNHRRTFAGSLGQFLDNAPLAADIVDFFGFHHHLMEIVTLVGGEPHRMQMGTDDDDAVVGRGTYGERGHAV